MASLEAQTTGTDQSVSRLDDLHLPEKLSFLLGEGCRYKVAYGGRGGMKSWTFARALLWLAKHQRRRVLCAREIQNSIMESVHRLLRDQIDKLGWSSFFRITDRLIQGTNGSEFIFVGLKNDPRKIKSMEGIDICWVAEAEKVSDLSWQILIPTIRKTGSEIWVEFNPDLAMDPTYKRFVSSPPPNARVKKILWHDNPFLPEELRAEKDYLASVDLEAYEHVWEGKPREHSAAQILKGKCVVQWFEIQPHWDGPYWGADFGFAKDPTALVKVWVGDNALWVERESYRLGLEIDQMATVWRSLPAVDQGVIRADGSRPETISYLNRQGLKVVAALKGPGSVEDGIAFLRSFENIIIHPECPKTIEESRLYSYKVDCLTNEVLPVVVDAHNHCIDAMRYALEPIMRQGRYLWQGRDLS